MDEAAPNNNPVTTVIAAFEILEFLKDEDGASLNELAQNLEIAKSTAHRHVTTLQHERFVVKEYGKYYPGLKFLEFGEYVRTRKPAYELTKQKVEKLANITGERVQFMVEENGVGVTVHQALGEHGVRTSPGIGRSHPLHATAAGKAILAHLPDQRLESIIERHGLEPVTENTITEKTALFEELKRIRASGYSVNREENLEGLIAVGVPLLGSDEHPIGVLSVSGPAHRMKGQRVKEELPDRLQGIRNELELNLIHAKNGSVS